MADLMKALRNADAAGDTNAANRIAAMIRNQGQASSVSANNIDVPGMEGEPIISDAAPRNDTLGDTLEGVGEAALTLGTGATTGALGFVVGTLTGALGELTGRLKPGEGLEEAQAFAAKMTNLPESEAGQDFVKSIGETLGTLPPILGSTPVAGMRGLPKSVRGVLSKSKSPLAKKIAEESTGNIKKSFTKKLDGERFTPRIFNMVKEAKKQGFEEGMTNVIANSKPIDKRRMLQMVSKMEKAKTDDLYAAKNRPADVAGDSILRQIDFIKSNNKKAGTQLGRVAKSLKGKDVDINSPVDKFMSDLENIGVTFDNDGSLNFEGSRIRTVAPSRKIITDIVDELNIAGEMDALKAHEFKGFLDENINFGKKQEGLSGKAESLVSSLRKGVNESIGDNYPAYKEANARFSDTIGVLNELEGVVGKKLNIEGQYADKAFGVALRTLLSNNKGRANMMTVIDNIESTSKKYGGSFEDDILTQVLFADELDAVFGGGGRTSLKGEVKKANVDAAIDLSQMSIPGAIAVGAKALNKRRLGINEKNQIKAIKDLLKAK